MRPPWPGNPQDASELEALQTDVMRFIAILGLCLAAIFSLVHSAALEQRAAPVAKAPPAQQPEPGAGSVPEPEAIPEPAAESQAVITPQASHPALPPEKSRPAPLPQPRNRQPGFTLEFDSAETLQHLLEAGHVQLYARGEDQFWSAHAQGGLSKAPAPTSYYHMHPDTVPLRYRRSLAAVGVSGDVAWGVTLPAATTEQIRRLTATGQGGNLVIGKDAGVTLESDPPS